MLIWFTVTWRGKVIAIFEKKDLLISYVALDMKVKSNHDFDLLMHESEKWL